MIVKKRRVSGKSAASKKGEAKAKARMKAKAGTPGKPKRKVAKGLSIKSPGGRTYKRIAERELKRQTKSARKKAKK